MAKLSTTAILLLNSQTLMLYFQSNCSTVVPQPQTVKAALLFDLKWSYVDGVVAVVWLHQCAKVKILLTTFASAQALVFHRYGSVIAKYGVESFSEI